MYLMYKHVLPYEIMNEINDFVFDDDKVKEQYKTVLRQIKWYRVLKELKAWSLSVN